MRRVTTEERRARLVRRHLLAPEARVSSVAAVAEALGALHSSDPSTVFLSVRARTDHLDADAIERELYDERTVLRMLGMRRTLFVLPRDGRPIVQSACTDTIAARERTRLETALAATPGVADPRSWLLKAEAAALEAVEAAGQAATAEVVRTVPVLATKVELGVGRWALQPSAGSRVLPLLAAQGKLLRGRPRGSWISGQYRWVPTRAWLGEDQEPVAVPEATARLVRAWLRANGPGTDLDLRWWTGLTARAVRAALAAVDAVSVELDGRPGVGFVLPDDLEPTGSAEPAAALLPTLDATTMAWKERDWYLGPHGAILFDRNGNAGPTVWWDGRVVGGWSQRRDGEIVVRLLDDVGSDAERAVERETERLSSWLGDVRLSPGFLPPFQRALGA
jgi:winged helix DNA-binding protein